MAIGLSSPFEVNTNFRLNARRFSSKIAVSDRQTSLTYRDLDQRITQLANLLIDAGLQHGDSIAVLLRNRTEWVEILYACARTGIVCVPVNFRFASPEIKYVLAHSETKALITERALKPKFDETRLESENPIQPNRILIVDEADEAPSSYSRRLAEASHLDPAAAVNENDCWYLGYTSGTTGRPKGTIISQKSRTIGAWFGAIEFSLGPDDTTLIVMPLFHSNAIFFQMQLLSVGGSVFIMPEFDAEGVLRTIAEQRITHVSLVPTMYAMMLQLPDETKARYDLSSLRVVLSSSAPLLPKTKEEILAFFHNAQIHEFYGSTEAGFVTNLRPHDQMRKLRCVGQPFFGTEVEIRRPDGAKAAPGEVGELFSRGLNHAYDGYFKNPEATAKAFNQAGWFTAGDLAKTDDEGFVYLVDRKNDLIISGGENIYPTEVEDVLIRHPAVAEVAVIGTPDPVWGDRVCAVIRRRPGEEQTTGEEIAAWCRGKIADYKRPRAVEFWDEIPKNPTGKILRRSIREIWAAREPDGPTNS